jgi:subfamily B ATP-binding cassette protein MsbA
MPELLRKLKEKFDVEQQLDDVYEGLKARFQIDERTVVFFTPLLFVLVYAFRSLASFTSGFSFQRVGLGVTKDVRDQLYRRILGQSSRFHVAHPSGELVSRVVNDVNVMQRAVSDRLLDLFQQSFTLVAMLVMLISIHARLATICLVVTPVLLYPIVRFGKGIRGTSHRSQERMADLAQLLSEGVRGHRVVKAFGMEGFELGRFRQATRRHLRVNLRAQVLANLSSPVIETMAALGGAALLIYAGLSIREGELSVGTLVQFLTTLLLMYDPIRRLNKVNLMLQEALAAAHRVADLMAVPDDIVDRPDGLEVDAVREEVRFEGVTFGYDHQVVLKSVDLRLRTGEMVALVGASGAGKSTLVNLLPRFFDPDEGEVTIDGVNIRDLKLRSLRSLIGIVTQETMLFDDTVRNNIAYGRSDLPLEAVREAAKAAFADEFVLELPKGYDTVVGEGGARLSGGQRQRLAIARALLKNAPILILDEATSQLDSESEALVQKALQNLMEGRTTLVIAHRLSTVTRADRIVVMHQGKIVEEGSHQELLALGGRYKRLYDLQFRV